jgi:putative transposase
LKLTVPIKLLTDDVQSRALHNTLVEANKACNYIAMVAWEHKCFSRTPLHALCYKESRARFNLAAQVIIRCIAKVVGAYAVNKKIQPVFHETGSIAYDARNLTIRNEKQYVTIWTQLGRIKINYTAGPEQLERLQDKIGECDLILRKSRHGVSNWYLHCSVETPEQPLQNTTNMLGVDLGIKNIAVTSDDTVYSGSPVNKLRHRHAKLRRKLQSKGTRPAKRLLKKRSKREHRFCTNQNHIIAKSIVAKAQCTNATIALENLKGIRNRTKVKVSANAPTEPQRATRLSRNMRRELSNWAFYQLKTFIQYKAKLVGVPIILVNPAHTSQTCPKCGYVSRYNRKDRDHFCCKQCGYADHADYVAAVNIARKALLTTAVAVNQPNVSVG